MKKVSVIILILIVTGLVIGCTNQKNAPKIRKIEEDVKISFKEQYPTVEDVHPFKEIDVYQLFDVFDKKKTSIVLVSYPKCPKCQQLIKPLTQVALNNDILEIKYLNVYDMRKNNTSDYKKLVKKLETILPFDDNGKQTIVMPLVLFIEKGEIVTYHQGTVANAIPTINYLDDKMTSELITTLNSKVNRICLKDCVL